jgi:hypothetical protein
MKQATTCTVAVLGCFGSAAASGTWVSPAVDYLDVCPYRHAIPVVCSHNNPLKLLTRFVFGCMCRDPAKAALPNVLLMQRIPPASSIVAYFDFVFKVGAGTFASIIPRLVQVLGHGWLPSSFGQFIPSYLTLGTSSGLLTAAFSLSTECRG